MIIDGEKYACEACVRGHRVSNCQHSNRPLQHINKKGRPVSQCAHCRSMRKSRAAHVKCDCGEKTSKCAHLQPTLDGHKETCCCNHGGRCSCSGKKDSPLGTVPESDSDDALNQAGMMAPKVVMRRRRAATVHSSDPGGLSFDQHGHHKTSKHRVSQKCGAYTLNRVNSAASTSSLATSTDSLVFSDGRSACGTREQRQVKSEATSPLISGSGFTQLTHTSLPPLDLSGIEYPSYNGTFDLFSNRLASEHDGAMFSANLDARSVDWSHYDLPSDSNGESFTPSSYSQAGTQSFNGILEFGSGSEQLPNLANTTSNSGDVSEVEDFLGGDDYEGFSAGASFLRQGVMGGNADLTSIDYSNFYKTDESNPLAGSISMVEDDPAFWMPNYNNDGITTVDENTESLASGTMGSFWDM